MDKNVNRVSGIGGIFFKSNDPEKLKAWYRDHLGMGSRDEEGDGVNVQV